MIIVRHA